MIRNAEHSRETIEDGLIQYHTIVLPSFRAKLARGYLNILRATLNMGVYLILFCNLVAMHV